MARDLTRDPEAFIDAMVKLNERGQPFRLLNHQREILRAAFTFDAEGRLAWDTFIWSAIKKEGKTTINAALLTWWAYTQEAPNELFVLANDQEQAMSRVFATAARLIKNNAELAASAKVFDRRITLTNGTTITALASEYAGAAGSNHGLTSWDELWAYTSEGSRRLWEEMTPIPTRRNSIRVITTYAGWENESLLLWDLYKTGVGPEEHPEGQGERVHPTLPIYLNRAARQITYWDHEPRAPWQTEAYRESQRKTLRPGAFMRLLRNQWAASESAFITPEMWDGVTEPDHAPVLLPARALDVWAGVDASTKGDSAAVVAVTRVDDALVVLRHRIWRPSTAAPLDLEQTIETYLRELHRDFRVASVYSDPYQMHRSITTLAAAGVPVKEYPQTPANLTRAGQLLFDLMTSRALIVYPDAELRQQALNTVAVENPRGFRISKDVASRKIDAIAALSFACVAAVDVPLRRPVRIL